MKVEPRSKSAREQRRDEMGRALVDALERLVAGGEPYTSLPAERIARVAGVSRATFYIYFEGKSGLMQAWLERVVEEFLAAGDAWRGLGASSSAADVQRALEPVVATYRRHASLLAAAAVEASQDRLMRDRMDSALDAAVSALSEQLQRGQLEGWVDPGLVLPESAAWAVCLLERGLDGLPPDVSDAEVGSLLTTLAVLAWNAFFREQEADLGRV